MTLFTDLQSARCHSINVLSIWIMVLRSGKTCDVLSKFNFVAGIEFPKSIHKGGKPGVSLFYHNSNIKTDFQKEE